MNKGVPGRIIDFCLILFTVYGGYVLDMLLKQRGDMNLDQELICTCLNNIVGQRSLRTAAKEVMSLILLCMLSCDLFQHDKPG